MFRVQANPAPSGDGRFVPHELVALVEEHAIGAQLDVATGG